MVKCPKCGSDQITANKKGFSGGKAVAGAILTGGVGLLAGLHGSKKIVITCLACGHNFKPGDRPAVKTDSSNKFDGTVNGNNAVICSKCNHVNPLFYNKCKECNAALTGADHRTYDSTIELKPPIKSGCGAVFIFFASSISLLIYFL